MSHRERMIMQAWCAVELMAVSAYLFRCALKEPEFAVVFFGLSAGYTILAGITLGRAREGGAQFSASNPLALPYRVYLSAKKFLGRYTYPVRRSHQ